MINPERPFGHHFLQITQRFLVFGVGKDEGQSGSLVAGKNFGIVRDIVTGPDSYLYVTSLSNEAVSVIH